MGKLGTKSKPAVVRVQTEEKAMEIMALCNERGWQVVVDIEPDKAENISDIRKLEMDKKKTISFCINLHGLIML